MFTINNAKFATFALAAQVAHLHAKQRGECKVRDANGTLLADFVPHADGYVSIFATDYGKPYVEDLAR